MQHNTQTKSTSNVVYHRLPEIEILAPNLTRVLLPVGPDGASTLSVWYSYRTVVAFAFNGARYVLANEWSNTTGRHLNRIDDGNKSCRVPWSDNASVSGANGAGHFHQALASILAGNFERFEELASGPLAAYNQTKR